jgi:hypothetical protein
MPSRQRTQADSGGDRRQNLGSASLGLNYSRSATTFLGTECFVKSSNEGLRVFSCCFFFNTFPKRLHANNRWGKIILYDWNI